MREGLIPTVLGTVVTAAGTALEINDMRKHGTNVKDKEVVSLVAAGIVGFGLAHVVLGTIDLVEHRR